MVNPINRNVTAPSGTTVNMDGDKLVISRQPGRPNRPPFLNANVEAMHQQVEQGNWKAARGKLETLAARHSDPNNPLPPKDQVELAKALKDTIKAAEKADERSVLVWILSILALGIPLLIDALVTNDHEALEKDAKALQAKLQQAGWDPNTDHDVGIMATGADGDMSGHMNLYVGNPLLGTTSKLAEGLGGPFVGMSDAVATQHYSKNRIVEPADFEASTGVVLIEASSRHIVSQDATGFYRMALDGKPVFKGADDALYFEPENGQAAQPCPAGAEAQVTTTRISDGDVGARARLPNDPDPRPNMRFTWHGYSSGELKVGWWGQCESSGMLGSMGLMPAPQGVILYDEKRGGEISLSANEINSMMVFMGRSNYFGTHPAEVAGAINRQEEVIDGDPAHDFHSFVMKQIESGIPFNLEAHSYEQIWNYPVHQASVTPDGRRKHLPGGGSEQRYEMLLTKSNGSTVTYAYTIEYDSRGKVVDSSWDMAANERANGKNHAVPDKLKSYFSLRQTRIEFNSGRLTYYEDNRWTPEAVAIVADLYFASQVLPEENEARIYAVRTADGKLLQMSQAEFEAFKASRAEGATGTGG